MAPFSIIFVGEFCVTIYNWQILFTSMSFVLHIFVKHELLTARIISDLAVCNKSCASA